LLVPLRSWSRSRSCAPRLGRVPPLPRPCIGSSRAKRGELQAAQAEQSSLSSALERYANRVDELTGQLAALRSREATVHRQLEGKQVELRRARAKLLRVRARLHRAARVLKERLVAIYESNRPGVVDVILSSHGFNQLSTRYAYLQSIQDQDDAIISRVRVLRNGVRDAVDRIHAERDDLAAKRAEIVQTEGQLEQRQSTLAAARDRKQAALSQVQANTRALQAAISDIENQMAAQAAARQAAAREAAEAQAAQQAASAPAPTGTSLSQGSAGTALSTQLGPVPAGEAISPFPASSPVTWGRTDQGVDGTTTPGSPLLAMGSGMVTIGHDPAGFGDSYPILHTSFGDYYYGHCVPTVGDGASVQIGQPIASAHTGTWGNSTTPGGFEIGAWPPGDMGAGAAIRSWLIGLPRR
jgi:peptidoglycan hydrolase CwlO-like protein